MQEDHVHLWKEREMNILDRLFGRTRKAQAEDPAEEISQEASALISAAVDIIETQVTIERGFVKIETGSDSKVMEAARHLEAAHKLHPRIPLLHYAWASALHLAAQFKSAEDEMRIVSQTHPSFILARFAAEGWERWKSPFTLPPLKQDSQNVHGAISAAARTCIVLATRDRINPRATLFLRDAGGDFRNADALKSARIDLTTVISPIGNPQVVGIYGRIWDDPSSPYGIEALDVPLCPRGDATRAKYEFLCTQQDMDLVIINSHDKILLNKRVPNSRKMQEANKRLLDMLETSVGKEMSTSEVVGAVMNHQRHFSTSDVQY